MYIEIYKGNSDDIPNHLLEALVNKDLLKGSVGGLLMVINSAQMSWLLEFIKRGETASTTITDSINNLKTTTKKIKDTNEDTQTIKKALSLTNDNTLLQQLQTHSTINKKTKPPVKQIIAHKPIDLLQLQRVNLNIKASGHFSQFTVRGVEL